jgi:hydrogenase maturation protein HypF
MTLLSPTAQSVRQRIRVCGVVQGVGFRPHVHRLATALGLSGFVGNDTEGVFVEVEGPTDAVERFGSRLVAEAPPMALIEGVEVRPLDLLGDHGFRIVDSKETSGAVTLLPPDVAVCDDCLAELVDPGDRRHRYPFINCTNCGPRFTITRRLPYDRPNTTMAGFPLCAECARQYHDPGDRRFHAQPLACPVCGPRLWFEGSDGSLVNGSDAALAETQRALADGQVVAIKGIGGYHLACDATNGRAVDELRRRKHRPDKPLAVMVADLEAAERLAHLDPVACGLLTSPQRPIVLVDRRPATPLAPSVAPGSPQLGLLLPYSPLHHLLFAPVPGTDAPVPGPLVMTSGNLTDEPICHDDVDARARLGEIADAWLVHDRPIHMPCDDSVVRVEGGGELPVRRARGFAPLPVRLPFDSAPLLATGGEMKNTFCLATGRHAWVSQHLGDVGSLETVQAYERALDLFARCYQVTPTRSAADAHPGYQIRQWAEDHTDGPVALVQHHHAHIASVMAEHAVPDGHEVVGFAFDGTGYGPDGAVWGGEVLIASYGDFRRATHLAYVPLPGGDAAVRHPARVALAHLWAAGIPWDDGLAPVRDLSSETRAVLARQFERDIECVPTSSMGRLFDAVSSLVGLRHTVSFEAQAAMELEALASSHRGPTPAYRFDTDDGRIDAAPVIAGIADDMRSGRPPGGVALGFHHAVASMMADRAAHLAGETGIGTVALSGGVFQNALLLGLARDRIRAEGLEVLTHRVVPPNDGGLSLGQVAVAASRAGASGAEARRAQSSRAESSRVRADTEPAMGEWAR